MIWNLDPLFHDSKNKSSMGASLPSKCALMLVPKSTEKLRCFKLSWQKISMENGVKLELGPSMSAHFESERATQEIQPLIKSITWQANQL